MKKQYFQSSYLKAQLEAKSLINTQEQVLLLEDEAKTKEIDLDTLMTFAKKSPKYRLYSSKIYSAKQELALTKTKLYTLGELYVYQERTSGLDNQNIAGLGLRISVPLWNRQNSQIEIKNAKIRKSSIKAQEVLYKLQKNIQSYYELYQNALKQHKEYKTRLLIPSKKFYEVSTLSYEAGEKSLLELLDAQTLYFQSQLKYRTLISQASLCKLQLYNTASINLLKEDL